MGKEHKPLGDGGAKERRSRNEEESPALDKENRQAVKNQGTGKSEDYPDRGKNVT